MADFFLGAALVYLLAGPLMMYVVEPMDEDDRNATFRFALLWPLAAIEVIWRMITGNLDDDGTGTN
jgi:hypothetical protein